MVVVDRHGWQTEPSYLSAALSIPNPITLSFPLSLSLSSPSLLLLLLSFSLFFFSISNSLFDAGREKKRVTIILYIYRRGKVGGGGELIEVLYK